MRKEVSADPVVKDSFAVTATHKGNMSLKERASGEYRLWAVWVISRPRFVIRSSVVQGCHLGNLGLGFPDRNRDGIGAF